ncbi:hypothetical protein Ms3S1_40400 [Methylosinus sp. 3S-1]
MPKHASDLDALRRGDLSGARALRLPGLTELPREVFGLADTLEVLDIGGGALTALPDDMGRLRRLRILFASNNRFERLPPALGDCESLAQIGFRAAGLREIPAESLPPSLRWLTLTDNRIERLPDALAQRPQLQKLMLAGNRLSALPRGLAEAPALELIRLAANRFETLPAWLGDIPTLAWISWNGNPAERALPAARAAAAPWAEIELGARLGGGASGDVFRATWRGRSVAVKLFRGAMTSDGAPESEMAASLSAGGHPHLVSALGRVVGHPEGRAGLMSRCCQSIGARSPGRPILRAAAATSMTRRCASSRRRRCVSRAGSRRRPRICTHAACCMAISMRTISSGTGATARPRSPISAPRARCRKGTSAGRAWRSAPSACCSRSWRR